RLDGSDTLPIKSKLFDYSSEVGKRLPTGLKATRAYRFSKFCMPLNDPEERAKFIRDPDAYMEAAGLSDAEARLVRGQDWAAMIQHGTNIHLVLRLAATLGVSQNRLGAMIRGETYEQFLSTRNVPEEG